MVSSRFDFHAGMAGAALQDDVHFVAVRVAQMMERDPLRMRAGLFADLAENEGLQQLAE